MFNTLILIYVGVSFLFGGIAATVELRSQPTMLDRADGRGKFPSPRLRFDEGLLFGLFVMILWPYLLIAMLVDVVSPGSPEPEDSDDRDP